MHTSEVVRLSEGGEPFDIRKHMWEGSEMGGQLKDNPYLVMCGLKATAWARLSRAWAC
jgi:hypothetical protein